MAEAGRKVLQEWRQWLNSLEEPPSRIKGAPAPPSMRGMIKEGGNVLLNWLEAAGGERTHLTPKDILAAPAMGVLASNIRGPGPGVGVFGGRNARTMSASSEAQHPFYGKAAVAESLERLGKSADDIYQSTGLWRGNEGQWRFNIPDVEAKMLPEAAYAQAHAGRFHTSPWVLRDFLHHPELYKSYPDIGGIPTQFSDTMRRSEGGLYYRDPERIDINAAMSLDDARSVLLHEIQHAIQRREGFTPGVHPDWMQHQLARRDPEMAQRAPWAGRALYQHKGGEVEARAVQHLDKLARQRVAHRIGPRSASPHWVEDIHRSRQLVDRPGGNYDLPPVLGLLGDPRSRLEGLRHHLEAPDVPY